MAPDLTGGADAGVSNEHSSTDLFGGIDRAGGEDDITTSAPDAGGYQATAGTGARNESSVLFSLSALTASEAGPTGPEAGMSASRSSDDSGLIDLQALTAADTAPVSAGGMAAGGAPGFGASPLMSAPLGGVSGPVLGGPIGGSYNKRSSTRAWILGGVGISALVLIAFAVFFKQGNIGAPSLSAETVKATTTVAEKTPAAPLPEKKAPVIAEGEEPVIPEPEAVKQPEPEPDALSAKDLAVVKAPPAKVVKKRRKAAVAKPRARRPKPAAKKPAPVKAKAPAPAPTAKPKKRKKKRKKKSCNCAPSDLMCAMQCSARKR